MKEDSEAKKLKTNSYFEKKTTFKNDRKVSLVVKKYDNSKQNTYVQMEIQ